jgi:hypothetical protein
VNVSYVFVCLVRQVQEDLQAKYKEMEKELKLYKEREAAALYKESEAASAAPPVHAPVFPKVVPSAPPKVVASAPPKVAAPSIPPAGLVQEDSSALSAESFEKAKTLVQEKFVKVAGKDQQAQRRILISRTFRADSYAIDGLHLVKSTLISAGEFDKVTVDQVAKYWDDKVMKRAFDFDQLVRDQRKAENVVVDGRLQQLINDTEDGNLLVLPDMRAGSWPLEGLLVNPVFRTIVTAARDGFQVKSGLNAYVVSRSWIANGFVRFEEFKVCAFLFV